MRYADIDIKAKSICQLHEIYFFKEHKHTVDVKLLIPFAHRNQQINQSHAVLPLGIGWEMELCDGTREGAAQWRQRRLAGLAGTGGIGGTGQLRQLQCPMN